MATSVQSIYQYWKQFDLPTLQKELDDVATEVANRQDESETSRKKLVELSRDFKKNASEEVRKVVTPLLKSFQAEVDGLSKRSKAAEAAFLTLYKKIVETPDPVQALENASQWQKKSQRAQDLEIENANLKSTLKEYTDEFAEVKNQEVTIRQLKAEIKQYEDQLENSVETRLAEKEANMKRTFDEREKELIEQNNVALAKVQEAEHRADALQTSLNAAQQELFVLRSHSDEIGSAKSSEMELLMSDLERANLRAASAERQCELLKEKITQLETLPKSIENESNETSQQHVEHELKLKDQQIVQLLEEVSQLNSKSVKDKAEFEGKIEELAKQLMQKKQALQTLEEKAELFADYDEIKRELAILKSIYLGGDDHETDESVTDSKSLEALLLEKNKALQLEKSTLNAKKRDLESELNQLQTDYKKLSITAEQQKQLINSLEQDLMQIQNFQRPEAEGAAAPDETATDVISNAIGNLQETVTSLSRTSPSANADSLLPIVISQRERFRSRVQEVEEQNLQLQQHIALLTSEIERIRNDNVKLYEKIKFLQTYKGNQSTNVNSTTIDETINRYSTQYEATLDPFQRFGVQERQRRYMALRTHDKATLSISRLIMSSGTARAVFFFYLIFLHCLVFLVLYKLAYTESCKRDFSTDCVEKYKEHMHLVHGKDLHS